MRKKEEKKAYDILSDEKFSVDSLSNKSEYDKYSDEKEIHIARIIYSYLLSQKKVPSKEEKMQIKKRIKTSVSKTNKNKYFTLWIRTAAASFLLVIFSVWYFQRTHNPNDILDFAQTLDVMEPDSVTHLILQNGRKILIDKEDPQIVYDKKGGNIIIDSDQKVSQEVVRERLVFNTLVVPYGKRTHITLYDGSMIWLNSGSKLIYPAVNTKEKREVYLEGEAIFEVAHSEQNPFFVNTKDFEIKVLGTVFNVSSYLDDKISCTVLEKGKIELAPKWHGLFQKEKLTILPGTMAVFNSEKETFERQSVNTKDYLSWRDGYLIFESEPLENILKKIARYYNVEIILQNASIGKETFSGSLDLKNTPEEVLTVIAETILFIIKNEDNKLIIN